ncbi:MAG: hypothetical protein ACJ8FN_10580 [Sphingomicrobium sp.]
MPTYRICILNEDFCATDDHTCPDEKSAAKQALRGALDIGTDQIVAGKQFFGAEVTVESGNERVGHFVVAVGKSSLKV